jgi:hypothetical protein
MSQAPFDEAYTLGFLVDLRQLCQKIGDSHFRIGHTMKPEPLTDAEFDRVHSVFARFGAKHAMNLEKSRWFPCRSDLRS